MDVVTLLLAALLSAPAFVHAAGLPTLQCGFNGLTLTIPNGYQWGKFVVNDEDYVLSLKNAACSYRKSVGGDYVFQWGLNNNECGNVMTESSVNSKSMYEVRNRFQAIANFINVNGMLIAARPNIYIDLVCKIDRNGQVTGSVICPVPDVLVAGKASVAINLNQYVDAALSIPLTGAPDAGATLYYELALSLNHPSVQLSNIRCTARPGNSLVGDCKCCIADFGASPCGSKHGVQCSRPSSHVATFSYELFFFESADNVAVECESEITCNADNCEVCPDVKRAVNDAGTLSNTLRLKRQDTVIRHGMEI